MDGGNVIKKYAKEFTISTAKQRSPQWYKERAGIPSSSGLGFLFNTKMDGTPSSVAKGYLRQLSFERHFKVTYENFQTKAMADGVFFEDFAKIVYKRDTGNSVEPATSYISSWFVSTPDGYVVEDSDKPNIISGMLEARRHTVIKGLLECKVVGDATFMEIIANGIPLEHELQIQGQLMASGLDWCDYIVVNLKTKAYLIMRQERNNKLIKRIYERLHEPLGIPEFNPGNVRHFEETLLNDYLGVMPVGNFTPEIIDNLPF